MQPGEHELKIEQIEPARQTTNIDMDWPTDTVDGFLTGSLLEMQRESGDGDSGAECKEPSAASPLATRKDFLEIKDALTNITREVQGAEKPKDNNKKISRIPVRQTRAPHTQTKPIYDKNMISSCDTLSSKTETDTNLEITDGTGTIEGSQIRSADVSDTIAKEKWREIKYLVEEEDYSLLEKTYSDCKRSNFNSNLDMKQKEFKCSVDIENCSVLDKECITFVSETGRIDNSNEIEPHDEGENVLHLNKDYNKQTLPIVPEINKVVTTNKSSDDLSVEKFKQCSITNSHVQNTIASDLHDIYQDFATIPSNMEHENSTESSLSPRAPIANEDELTSDEFTIGDETILEAPEEFRGEFSDSQMSGDDNSGVVSKQDDLFQTTAIRAVMSCPSVKEQLSPAHSIESKRASSLQQAHSTVSDVYSGGGDTRDITGRDHDKQSIPEMYAGCGGSTVLNRDSGTVGTARENEIDKDMQAGRICMIKEDTKATTSNTIIHGELTAPCIGNSIETIAEEYGRQQSSISGSNDSNRCEPITITTTATTPSVVEVTELHCNEALAYTVLRGRAAMKKLLEDDTITDGDLSASLERLAVSDKYVNNSNDRFPTKPIVQIPIDNNNDEYEICSTTTTYVPRNSKCTVATGDMEQRQDAGVCNNGGIRTMSRDTVNGDEVEVSCDSDSVQQRTERNSSHGTCTGNGSSRATEPIPACGAQRTLAVVAAAAVAAVQASIVAVDVRGAQATRCSRVSTVKVCAAPRITVDHHHEQTVASTTTTTTTSRTSSRVSGTTDNNVINNSCPLVEQYQQLVTSNTGSSGSNSSVLCARPQQSAVQCREVRESTGLNWEFRNGRLVFITAGAADRGVDNYGPASDRGTSNNESECDDNSASDRISSRLNTTDTVNNTNPVHYNSANSDHSDEPVPVPSLFDVLDQCTDRIECEIAKCNALPDNQSTSTTLADNDQKSVLLRSRDINRRSTEGGSRLKLLETKLKEAAGLSDKKQTSPTAAATKTKPSPTVNRWKQTSSETLQTDIGADDVTVVSDDTGVEKKSEEKQVVDNTTKGVEQQKEYTSQIVSDVVLLDKNDNECKETEVERATSRADGSHRRDATVDEEAYANKELQEEEEEEDEEDFYSQIEITELGSPADLNAFLDDRFGGRCEFDVKRIGAFSGFGADSEFYLVYDELEERYSSSGDDDERDVRCGGNSRSVISDDDDDDLTTSDTTEEATTSTAAAATVIAKGLTMRGDGGSVRAAEGGDHQEQRKRHNPDHDNLKSLLKKPGRGKESSKKNRVSFNENKNEFFDADYIILIREECDYDEDDDDGVCTCNQHEMVRLTCCEPNCNCNYDAGGYEGGPTPQSPKFAPPLEFVDSVTLSPPEGYKDMDLGEQQLIALQQMARHRQQQQQQQQKQQQQQQQMQQQAVCRECSGVHDSDSNSGSDIEEPHYIEKPRECISQEEYQHTQISGDHQSQEEKDKTDQSQQTTPTTPPADCTPAQSRYIMETITMTTVTERRLVREVEDTPGAPTASDTSPSPSLQGTGSPISGILKGGKLWKQQSITDGSIGPPSTQVTNKASDNVQMSDASNSITSDEEGNTVNRRSVRFSEADAEKRDSCDGEADKGSMEETDKKSEESSPDEEIQNQKDTDNCNNSVSPDATEMMLTFKLGNHVLISNNSLRPNSAVRQLFPCSKPMTGTSEEDGSVHQYLVTAESLKAFEEAKRSKLPQIMQSDSDDTIRRTIERNTLRRSLIRYEPRSKKLAQKTDNSLVERIKQLTCDVDEPPIEEEIPPRGSPPGEESAKATDTVNQLNNRNQDKSFSPSSSSTSSSNSSMSSTYKKITDLFGKREKATSDAQNNAINDSNNKQSLLQTAPDLGNGGTEFIEPQNCAVSKVNATSEARKQFLSTLAPLTACVSGSTAVDEYQYQYQLANNAGERASVASTVGTEYSLEDIDEALKNDAEDSKKVAPDVLVGTPSASESTDELAMFVQQDAGRIERIKKRYQPENATEEDDEHDDYGFNRRPSVRGIKPRFGSTTEILQQIQSQLQPPANPQPTTTQQRQANHVWPYYSETGLDNPKSRTCPQSYPHHQYPYVPEDMKSRTIGHQYRPTSLIEENIYQNCPNQRCTQIHYAPNVNQVQSPVMRIGGGCSDFYQTLPSRTRTSRPESPPPMDVSRTYHQTMVLIPYSRIEGFQSGNVSPNPIYSSPDQCNYARFANKKLPPNIMNKRYPEPVYHGTLPARLSHSPHMDDPQYQLKMGQKQMIRVPYSSGQPVQVHLMTARSESPLPGQFATARATQTPSVAMSTCNYYSPGPPNTRYRPAIGPVTAVPHNGTMWHSENPYGNKINRHSFPAGGPRYALPDNISLADSDSQHSGQLPNGYRQATIQTQFPVRGESSAPGSPTKTRFTSERGVPEGAASVSPQDSTTTTTTHSASTSTMTSPTSPQNPQPPAQNTNGKSLYYAMNV